MTHNAIETGRRRNADALVCAGRNDHLVALATSYGLPVYEVV